MLKKKKKKNNYKLKLKSHFKVNKVNMNKLINKIKGRGE